MKTKIEKSLSNLSSTEQRIWDTLVSNIDKGVTVYAELIPDWPQEPTMQHHKKRTLNVYISKLRTYIGVRDVYEIQIASKLGYKLIKL